MTRSFTYSASGNVTLDDLGGSGTVLTYNSLDRLVRVSAGAVTLVDYVYAAPRIGFGYGRSGRYGLE